MAFDLSKYLVVAISSTALFDLDKEHNLYESQGLQEYEKYQISHEDIAPEPGTGFPLVQAILHLNDIVPGKRKTEVVIISRNSPAVSLRIFNGTNKHNLQITRAAFTSGEPVSKYLSAFDVDLFLSKNETDVKASLNCKIAAGLLYAAPQKVSVPLDQIKIAFDGDAVIFSDESERIYQNEGLDAFLKYEKANANKPLPEGPFAKLLKTISLLQREFEDKDQKPIRTALITARNSPAHERVIKTLRTWNVRMDEMFFMGGVSKQKILESFQPHIFFDDQDVHCKPASISVPTAKVISELGSN